MTTVLPFKMSRDIVGDSLSVANANFGFIAPKSSFLSNAAANNSRTLVGSEHGSVFAVDCSLAGILTVNLPALGSVPIGTKYTFVFKTAPAATKFLLSGGAASSLCGSIPTGGASIQVVSTLTSIAVNASWGIGDRISALYTGDRWNIGGGAALAATVATA